MSYNKLIGLVNNNDTVINTWATNNQLQNSLIAAYPLAVKQMLNSGFYNTFKGETVNDTAANIWHYLKGTIKYKKDPDGVQYIMLPARFIKRGVGDCKNYSLFTASILGSLGLPVFFDFTNYISKDGKEPINKKMPSHVYISTLNERGQRVIIDGVYNKFDSEKPYFYKKTVPMKIAVLSGLGTPTSMQIERNQITDSVKQKQYRARVIKGEITKLLNSADPIERAKGRKYLEACKAKNINGIAGKKKDKKNRPNPFAKVGLVTVRNSFLALVKLNVRGLAHKLSLLIAKPGGQDKLKNTWVKKLGGNFDVLLKNINQGKGKRPLLGEGKKTKGLAGEPVSLTVILASAAGALAAIAPLLKNISIGPDGKEVNKAQEAPGTNIDDVVTEGVTSGGTTVLPQGDQGGEGFMNKKILGLPLPVVLLLAGGGVYLATKKKGR